VDSDKRPGKLGDKSSLQKRFAPLDTGPRSRKTMTNPFRSSANSERNCAICKGTKFVQQVIDRIVFVVCLSRGSDKATHFELTVNQVRGQGWSKVGEKRKFPFVILWCYFLHTGLLLLTSTTSPGSPGLCINPEFYPMAPNGHG
jgi:hypothetical protein